MHLAVTSDAKAGNFLAIRIPAHHPPNAFTKWKQAKPQSPPEDGPPRQVLGDHCLTAKIRKAFPSRGALRLKEKGEHTLLRALWWRGRKHRSAQLANQ